jgi:hypothetical protein
MRTERAPAGSEPEPDAARRRHYGRLRKIAAGCDVLNLVTLSAVGALTVAVALGITTASHRQQWERQQRQPKPPGNLTPSPTSDHRRADTGPRWQRPIPVPPQAQPEQQQKRKRPPRPGLPEKPAKAPRTQAPYSPARQTAASRRQWACSGRLAASGS